MTGRLSFVQYYACCEDEDATSFFCENVRRSRRSRRRFESGSRFFPKPLTHSHCHCLSAFGAPLQCPPFVDCAASFFETQRTTYFRADAKNMDESSPIESRKTPDFVSKAEAVNGSGNCVGITADGITFTWGRTNRLGQLGRPGKARKPAPAVFGGGHSVCAAAGFAGGMSDSGHAAIVDVQNRLWMTGCDRWQQLGLGSSNGGAAGYTWTAGKIFQTEFVENKFVPELLQKLDPSSRIRDVAIGGDHTVVLSSNQRDVVTFGKGAEGQLGLGEKRFVSAPAKASLLSSSVNESKIAAVCATEFCSLTLDEEGDVLKTAGRCRPTQQNFCKSLQACRERAEISGLLGETQPDE